MAYVFDELLNSSLTCVCAALQYVDMLNYLVSVSDSRDGQLLQVVTARARTAVEKVRLALPIGRLAPCISFDPWIEAR